MAFCFGLYALLVAAGATRLIGKPLWIWVSLTGALAGAGLLAHFDSFPPPVLRLVLPALLVTVLLCLSSVGRGWLERTSLASLIGFQAFRFPLELIMHWAAREGVMPPQMTFTGRNWDILTGLLALPLAWLVSKGKLGPGAVWVWNVVGLGLLVNVVGVAILSVPGPFRVFMNEPANTWIAHFPFIWLPTVLVPLALAGHVLVARKLLTR